MAYLPTSSYSVYAESASVAEYAPTNADFSSSVALFIDTKQNSLVVATTYEITSSWAEKAISSNTATSASHALASNTATSAVTATSASHALVSDNAVSSAYAPWEPAASSSVTAQLASKQPTLTNTLYVITASNATTASWAPSPITENAGALYYGTERLTMAAQTLDPTGFPSASQADTTLNYDSSSYRFSITGSNFKIYAGGKEYVKNSEAIVLGTPVTRGLVYYVSYNVSTGNIQSSTNAWIINSGNCPIAAVYIGADGNGFISNERHGIVMDSATQMYLHDTIGPRFSEGFVWTTLTASNGTYNVGVGEWHDDDNTYNNALASASINAYYTASLMRLTTTPTSSIWGGGVPKWNDITTGQLTNLTAGQRGAMFLYAINGTVNKYLAIYGQRTDSNLTNARNNNLASSLVLGNFPYQEALLLYRIIMTSGGIEDVTDYRGAQFAGTTYTATSHAALTGLAADDHPQYLLLAGRGGMTINDPIVIANDEASTQSLYISSNINNQDAALIRNISGGPTASADFMAYNDSGSYTDMGTNGSGYAIPQFVGNSNDGYVFHTGSEFFIGNITPNKGLHLFAGGTANTSSVRIDSTGKLFAGQVSATVVTASLQGTASWAEKAVSASWAPSNAVATSDSSSWASASLSASYATFATDADDSVTATSSSHALFADQAYVALGATSADTASFVALAQSSSYAPIEPNASASITTQLASKQPNLVTAATYTVTSSWAENSTNANSATTATSASHALVSDTAVSAAYAPTNTDFSQSVAAADQTKQNVLVTGGTYTITSSWAESSVTAGTAGSATTATSASHALVSNTAVSAAYAPTNADFSSSVASFIDTKQNTLVSTGVYSITSSWAQTASVALNVPTSVPSASWASSSISASYAPSSGYTLTASDIFSVQVFS